MENKSIEQLKKALLVGTYSVEKGPAQEEKQKCLHHLDELERLCDTYGISVADKVGAPLRKIDPGVYLGKGKLEELRTLAGEIGADLILFDDEISPKQQQNLEKFFKKSVIDRTELILEVFALHARTREARLQIELAKMRYQMPRLRRLWTHLSRQSAGGGGVLRGEGEQQIEVDRRILKRKISSLQKELAEIKAQREVKRKGRMRSQIPAFAIVGYTNVGKSTLLKALTDADILAEDQLFATLDTTTRRFILPSRQEIVLIDTVGFIRKIPHTLVAAFRSTLEEAAYTDILLHIVDISHPMAEEQAEETHKVLRELKVTGRPIITVLNKVDRCKNPALICKMRIKYPKVVAVSALTREGFDELLEKIEEELSYLRKVVHLRISQKDYRVVGKLNEEAHIFSSTYEGNDILLKVEIPCSLEDEVKPFLIEG